MMNNNKYYNLVIDALVVCCTSRNQEQYWEDLAKTEEGDTKDMFDFYLRKIEGKHFSNVFQICYYDPILDKDVVWGELKYGISKDRKESNHNVYNGDRFIWLSLNNRTLYSERTFGETLVTQNDIAHLYYFMEVFNLDFYHISTIDIALDGNKNFAKRIKSSLRCKQYDTILNGKKIKDRLQYRPEIRSDYTGNLNKDTHLTLYIKQKNAIQDKNDGMGLIAYDKNCEIMKSGKDYISEFYGNPKVLHRLEIHFNSKEIREYFAKRGLEQSPIYIFDKDFLLEMFEDALNRLVRFEENGEKLGWGYILFGRRQITTPSAKVMI